MPIQIANGKKKGKYQEKKEAWFGVF